MKKITLTVLLIIFALGGCSSEKPARLKIGDQAPAFVFEGLDGKTIPLASLQNQPVILRFFITDCKFCKADTPVFNDYYNKHKDQGLMVLYLTTTTDRGQVAKFAKDLNISFPVGIDANRKISELFNIKVKPQTIVFDANHLIRGAILGGVTEVELEELLGAGWQTN